jgi:transcriptional regulator with XRE-family HTH domain
MSKIIRPYGSRLRSERNRLGITQTQLASAGGISKPTQVAYESDTYVPDLQYLERISSADVDKIFVVTGKTTSQFVTENFDWKLHQEVVEVVMELSDELGVQLPAVKLSGLVRILYEKHAAGEALLPEVVSQYLRLVA